MGLLPEGKLQQPWSLFTSNGELLVRENDIIRDNDGIGLTNKHLISNIITSGMIVITNGGNWVSYVVWCIFLQFAFDKIVSCY